LRCDDLSGGSVIWLDTDSGLDPPPRHQTKKNKPNVARGNYLFNRAENSIQGFAYQMLLSVPVQVDSGNNHLKK